MRKRIARALRHAANRLDPRKPIDVSLDWNAMARTWAAGMQNIEASREYARRRYGVRVFIGDREITDIAETESRSHE